MKKPMDIYIKDVEKQLMWFNHFVDYVGQMNSNLYNEACEYSDNCEHSL